jgi:MFS family permease
MPAPTPAPASSPIAPLAHTGALLAAICALAWMSTVGVAIPYPILAPLFASGAVDNFTHFAGAQPTWLLGIALAANPLGILLGSLVLGPLSDRFGRRRLLMLTLVATAFGHLVTAFALQQRLYLLFVLARWGAGLAEGNVAIARALLADLHPQIDRTRGFARLNASLYAGWLIGPLLGGWTLAWGAPVPFLLAAGATLPCMALLAWGLPAGLERPTASAAGPDRRGWRAWLRTMGAQQTLGLLWQDPALARLFVWQLACTAGITALYEFSPLWMVTEAGFDARAIALAIAGQCAVMSGSSLLIGRRGGTRRPLHVAAAAAALCAAGLAGLAALPGGWGVAMVMALGAPIAVYNAVLPAWMSERFDAHGQGRVMGLLSTIFCLANVAVALAGGWLSQWQVRWVMGGAALACLLAAAGLARWARQEGLRGTLGGQGAVGSFSQISLRRKNGSANGEL